MSRKAHIAWPEVLELRVIRRLKHLLQERWRLTLEFVSQDGSLIQEQGSSLLTPSLCDRLRSSAAACQVSRQTLLQKYRASTELDQTNAAFTCYAGLKKILAPVVIEGELQGAIMASGFVGDEQQEAIVRQRVEALGLPAREQDQALAQIVCLSPREESSVRDLLELMAEEVANFQNEAVGGDRRQGALTQKRTTRYSYDEIIGESRPMKELYALLDKVINSDSTVMIQGENGTGKELIARAIHFNSSRKEQRFVVQNCSAFNDNLLDSELFGHKKGSFTGAISDSHGLFEVADGGTFFLDEIGDMSPSLQVKLLRVLQEGTFLPVGDTEPKHVDVRIIAATNRDLRRMVERGEFREDLFYRINVINITIPTLRERKEDIAPLVEHFLAKHSVGRNRGVKLLAKGCLDALAAYNWPGNIRELENEIERMIVLAGDEKLITEEILSARIRHPLRLKERTTGHESSSLPAAVKDLERTMIYEVLRRHHWNKSRAAKELRISRRNLIRKVSQYQLDQRQGPEDDERL